MKKKSKLLIGIIAAIAALTVVIISIVVTAAGDNKDIYNSHMELAQRYLDEMQYEQAIIELVSALEIEPNNQRTLEALKDAYLAYAQSYIEIEQYDDAVRVLQDGLALLSSEKM